MAFARTGRDQSASRKTAQKLGMVEPPQSILHLIHRLEQSASDLFFKSGATPSLTPRQFVVLQIIGQNEAISQTGVVDLSSIDRSTVAEMVRRLEKRKFLQRKRTKEDARRYALKLTDEGRKVIRNTQPMAKRVDAEILKMLSAKERGAFAATLVKIVTSKESRV